MTTTPARFKPTDEQERALELFLTGESLAIVAGAGAGKTATLQLLAEAAKQQGRRGQYTAFNKSIVVDAGGKMPDNVVSSTFHSLAFGAMREKYAHRLGSSRVVGSSLAKLLRVTGMDVTVGGAKKWLAPGFLAGVAMKGVANFCNSGDDEPTVMHVPRVEGIDLPKPDGSKGWASNRAVAQHVLPAMQRAWADLRSSNGTLGFRHEHYLKIWALDGPRINADFIMVDEFQDSSGVMLSILDQQHDAQLVGVGDASQAINGWMGAVDALSKMDATHRTTLSRSWRFGPDIATVANGLLGRLDAELRLTGGGGPSTVGYIARPRCILTRTNAQGVKIVLALLERNIPVHLMGGGKDVVQFAQAAQQLMAGERAYKHPELAAFSTWAEVQEYAAADLQGGDLKLLVTLIDEHGPDVIIEALSGQTREVDALCTVSTAHKSKGREWETVRIASDFRPPKSGGELSRDELMLAYVAVTRARKQLDVEAVPHFLAAPSTNDNAPF